MKRSIGYLRQTRRYWARASASVLLVTLIILPVVIGCSKSKAPTAPFIPPQYYNCVESTPELLINSYYNTNTVTMVAAAQFDGEYFVFKNVAVTDLMFKHVDEGYFWDGQVKCELLNPGDLSRYKIGDRLDIVGQNEGIVVGEAALLMKDCIILPAGIVQLPAPGGGGLVPTGY